MSTILLAVGVSIVCTYVVVAINQHLDVLTFVSGNSNVYNNCDLDAKTGKIQGLLQGMHVFTGS